VASANAKTAVAGPNVTLRTGGSTMPYLLEKWGLEVYHDEAGRQWSINPSTRKTRTQCGDWCSTAPPDVAGDQTRWAPVSHRSFGSCDLPSLTISW
jgi:hypothetical protein